MDAARIGSKNRQLGKVQRLALGYGMGALKFVGSAAGYGVVLPLKEARRVQKGWRKNNPKIVELWGALEDAFIDAIKTPGEVFQVGPHLSVWVKNSCLFLRLPSGRCLRYWRPRVVTVDKTFRMVNDDGEIYEKTVEKREVQFFTQNDKQNGMKLESTYGGKLVENATQACARDFLGEALVRIDAVDPYDLVVHVHDSAAADVPEGEGDVEEFCEIMREVPKWGLGCPIDVDGYRDVCFRG